MTTLLLLSILTLSGAVALSWRDLLLIAAIPLILAMGLISAMWEVIARFASDRRP